MDRTDEDDRPEGSGPPSGSGSAAGGRAALWREAVSAVKVRFPP